MSGMSVPLFLRLNDSDHSSLDTLGTHALPAEQRVVTWYCNSSSIMDVPPGDELPCVYLAVPSVLGGFFVVASVLCILHYMCFLHPRTAATNLGIAFRCVSACVCTCACVRVYFKAVCAVQRQKPEDPSPPYKCVLANTLECSAVPVTDTRLTSFRRLTSVC